MRNVIFIKDLVIEEVRAVGHVEYFKMGPMPALHVPGEQTALLTDATVERTVVPINRICHSERDDVYIAYSDEVEELLGVPIRAILLRADESERAVTQERTAKRRLNNKWKTMEEWNWLDRFCFLMGGKRFLQKVMTLI